MKINIAMLPSLRQIKIQRLATALLIVAVVSALFIQPFINNIQATAAVNPNFDITISMDGSSPIPPTPVDVGQVLTYRIDYSCHSLLGDCGTFTVTDIFGTDRTILNVSTALGYTPNSTGQSRWDFRGYAPNGGGQSTNYLIAVFPYFAPTIEMPNDPHLSIHGDGIANTKGFDGFYL